MTERGGARTGFEVFLLDRAGLAEMDLAVDHPRKKVETGAVDGLACARLRQVANRRDGLAKDSQVARRDAVLIDQHAATQDEVKDWSRHGASKNLTRVGPKLASARS